ncbi:sequestosome-1 [Onthophagus taurus]|uniref:sequestosome-1 n=1 Tax=Onthophagus taurus TaxID=166361 RepID=UPI0039BDBAEE
MNSDSVIFKVFLKTNDSIETRKFVVDDVSVITSFLYIKGKLAMVFPKLNNVPFEITWKDMDGDNIIIDNDEDLVMAFTEMSGPVKVLYVTATQPHQENPSRVFGVYCDACNKEITGYRYKCLQCPDFDLCSDCEHAGHHKEHYMLRSANGELPFSGMCKRISENINKSIKKAQSMAYKEAHRNAKHSRKYEKKCDHASKFKCGNEDPVNFYEIPESVMEMMNNIFMGYPRGCPFQNQNQQQESQPQTSQQSQTNEGQQQTNEGQQQQTNGGQQQQQPQQPPFVDMIMKALSNIFPEPRTTQASTRADVTMNAPTPTPTPTGNGQSQQPQGGSSGQSSSPMEEDVDMRNPIPKSQSWTIINHDSVQNVPGEVLLPSQIPQVSQIPQAPQISQASQIPQTSQIPMPTIPQYHQIPPATAPINPQDQKILDGLKQLKDMGFKDHPELLALLKRYDGQVGFVIKHIFDNNDNNII